MAKEEIIFGKHLHLGNIRLYEDILGSLLYFTSDFINCLPTPAMIDNLLGDWFNDCLA